MATSSSVAHTIKQRITPRDRFYTPEGLAQKHIRTTELVAFEEWAPFDGHENKGFEDFEYRIKEGCYYSLGNNRDNEFWYEPFYGKGVYYKNFPPVKREVEKLGHLHPYASDMFQSSHPWSVYREYAYGELTNLNKKKICGVVCNACKQTLPPHDMDLHLDKEWMDNFHTCATHDEEEYFPPESPVPSYTAGADWAEIDLGIDAFSHDPSIENVYGYYDFPHASNFIICTNPPYSCLKKVLNRCLELRSPSGHKARVISLLLKLEAVTPARLQMMEGCGYFLHTLEICKVYEWMGMTAMVIWKLKEEGDQSKHDKDETTGFLKQHINYNRTVWRDGGNGNS